jgi:mediator of RNA polymerase II transcription subunit 23
MTLTPPGPKENKAQLKKTVEDEYKTWSSMSNEHDIVQHFSNPNNTNFLCVIWKMLLDNDTISPVAFKVRLINASNFKEFALNA